MNGRDTQLDEDGTGPRRAPKACVECHRLKQKCDAFDQYPDPCTRCKRRLRTCTFSGGGSNAKGLSLLSSLSANMAPVTRDARVDKNRNISQAPRHNLQGSAATSEAESKSQSVGGVPSLVSVSTITESYHASPAMNIPTGTHPTASMSSAATISSSLSQHGDLKESITLPCSVPDVPMGNTSIPKERLGHLYFTFIKYFYPNLPIIPPALLEEKSPLFDSEVLFLTMCLVAAAAVDRELVSVLRARVKPLIDAKSAYISFNRPYEAQAFLFSLIICCYWPLATTRLHEEVAFFYSGMALYSSLQLGLHHSALPHDIGFDEQHSSMRYSAWKAVTVVCQLQCMLVGVPNTVPTMGFYNDANFNDSRMSELIKQSEILKLYSRAVTLYGNNPEFDCGLASPMSRGVIHAAFMDSFGNLAKVLQPMSPLTKLLWYITRIAFDALLLLPGTPTQDMQTAITSVYTNSLLFAEVLQSFSDDRMKLLSLPIFVSNSVVYISSILLKVLSSSFAYLLDEAKALSIVDEFLRIAPTLVRAPPLSETENPACFHWLLSALSSFKTTYEDRRFSDKIATTRTRLGASILTTAIVEMIKERQRKGDITVDQDIQPDGPLAHKRALAVTTANGNATSYDSQPGVSSTYAGNDSSLNMMIDNIEFWEWGLWGLTADMDLSAYD